MARKRRQAAQENPNKASGLEYAWSSSPRRPPRYVLYCFNHETNRQYVINSHGTYAAKKLLDALTAEAINKEDYRVKGNTISFGDIDIRSDELSDILAHKYTNIEAEWELPAPYPNEISNFLHGAPISRGLIQENRNERGELERPVPKPKIDRSGKVTVQDIAAELKMHPRDARTILRKAKIAKPEGGWLGDAAWADGIRKALKDGQKASQ